jgi:hypothetical protein
LPQIAADYRISAYFRDSRGVYVNLYVPSTLKWNDNGAQHSITQTTRYPYDSHIRLDLAAASPNRFSVFLRIPEWAHGASLLLNGVRQTSAPEPGAFAEIRREWKSGDRIELDLPLTRRLEAVDAQHPDTVALMNGPLVLMPLREADFEQAQASLTRSLLLSSRQAAPGSHEWKMTSNSGQLTLKPFMDIAGEPYTTYVKVSPA